MVSSLSEEACMLVRLTTVGGGEVYINSDHVVAIEETSQNEVLVFTTGRGHEGRVRAYQIQGMMKDVAVALGADRRL